MESQGECSKYDQGGSSQAVGTAKATAELLCKPSSEAEENEDKMNDSRRQLLQEIRKQLDDVLRPEDSDIYLMKFLKSSNYNVKKAVQNFRQKLYTREVYKLDTMDTWEKPEVTDKYEFHGYLGLAKDGSPIRYVCSGKADFIGFIKSMSVFTMSTYCARILESDIKTLEKQSKITGEEIGGITYIFDLEELSLLQFAHKPVVDVGLDLIRMLQDHYPDIWKVIICVNAPFYFDTAFNLFKPMMRNSLINKVRVRSKENSPAELLKRIDADVLPAFLGGNRVDSKGDPKCSEIITFGGQVTPDFYLLNHPHIQETEEGVQTLWVAARSCHNFFLVVKEAGSQLRLRLKTEKACIGLCLLYKKFGSDPDSNIELPPVDQYLDENDENSGIYGISPAVMAQCHIAPIDNTAFCPWPGIYIFRLDNTFSWITSKKVIYQYWVVPPPS